jgi:hypothetical protein
MIELTTTGKLTLFVSYSILVIFIINIVALILIPLAEAALYITENISRNIGQSLNPKVHSNYVTWKDDTAGNPEVFFKKIGRGDATTINLSNNAGVSDFPQISASGNNVYVVWQDGTPGNYEVFFTASTTGGASFTDVINLSNNAEYSGYPQISASGNNVYVVWQDYSAATNNIDIYFRKSTDGGASFTDVINLSNNAGVSQNFQLITSGNNVYVVWQDGTPGNYEVFFTASTTGGASFTDVINLSNNAGVSSLPQISTSQNNVFVVWQDNSLGNYEVFFRSSFDHGSNFNNPINLSGNRGSSYNQEIAISSNNVYITWQDGTFSTSDIFFRTSGDKGITFGSTIDLSHNVGISQYPKIATRGDNEVQVYWLDNTRGWQNNVRGTDDVFFRKSMDAGNSFDNRVDNTIPPNVNNGMSDSPTMEILPGGTTRCTPGTDLCTFTPGPTYSLIWADNMSGNFEIFFTAGD